MNSVFPVYDIGIESKSIPSRAEPRKFRMTRPTFTLPVVSTEAPAAEWHGFTPSGALAAPEPDAPQGQYALMETPTPVPVPVGSHRGQVELLAPAGGPDSAFAAFHYGADA